MSAPWNEQRLCGLDFESTGLNVESDRIVTACVVQCGGGQPTQSAAWLADPGVDIPAEATAVHGITTARARAEGAPAREVVESLVAALAQVQRDGIPIVAANAPFDLTLLDREARRHGVQPLVDIIGADQLLVVDPMVIDRRTDRYRRGSRNLAALCAHYEVPLDGAHSADADAIAACRVAWRIAAGDPALAATPLPRLHEQQTGWAAEQAASRAAYFARTPGKEHLAHTVRPQWPMTTLEEIADVR
jgi:DNA polymerase-3 subunit epsilon